MTTYLINTVCFRIRGKTSFDDISFLLFVLSRLLSDMNYPLTFLTLVIWHNFEKFWHKCLSRHFSTSLPLKIKKNSLQFTLGWIRSHNPVIIAVRPLIKEKSGFYSPDKKIPQGKPILNYSCLDPFAVSAGMRPAQGRCLGFLSRSGNAGLFYGGIRARGSRRPIVSQRCSGPNLSVESARHWLQSQQTVRVERQLWFWLIRLNHLPSDWWRRVWEWSHYQLYLACWL